MSCSFYCCLYACMDILVFTISKVEFLSFFTYLFRLYILNLYLYMVVCYPVPVLYTKYVFI